MMSEVKRDRLFPLFTFSLPFKSLLSDYSGSLAQDITSSMSNKNREVINWESLHTTHDIRSGSLFTYEGNNNLNKRRDKRWKKITTKTMASWHALQVKSRKKWSHASSSSPSSSPFSFSCFVLDRIKFCQLLKTFKVFLSLSLPAK